MPDGTIVEGKLFLSTPSARRATYSSHRRRGTGTFLSTPSARRATLCFVAQPPVPADFYPRPPRGGRPRKIEMLPNTVLFLSTPSARRATKYAEFKRQRGAISIHALREEGDQFRR